MGGAATTKRNSNRREFKTVRRNPAPSRVIVAHFAAASLVILGVGAFAGTSASASPPEPQDDLFGGRAGAVRVDTAPVVTMPEPLRIPEPELPEGYEFPDDDADPEFCGDDCPDDEPRVPVKGGRIEVPGADEDYDGPYPNGCGPDELVACPDETQEERDCEHFEQFAAGICDEPDESTTTTVADSTTSTTSYTLEEIDVQVADATESNNGKKDETLAFTGSNSVLSLIGAAVLAIGVLIAGLSVASRSRDEEAGEHQGQA